MFTAEFIPAIDHLAPTCLAIADAAYGMPSLLAGLLAEDAVPEDLPFFQRILGSPLILPVGLFILFYFTFILPERRRKAEEKDLMSSLKKNDRVVTVGGIHGTVVANSPETGVVTVRIDEQSNTRIKVNRSAIARIVGDEKENKKASNKESAAETKDS